MKISHAILVCVALWGGVAASLQAQTVWRCGVDGRSYGDAPCTGGQVVAVADLRSQAEQAQAQTVLVRDRRLAQALVAERHEREREARLQGNGLAAIRNGPGELSPRPKPQLKPAAKLRPKSKRRPDAGAGTSRAAARASRRDPG